MLRNEGKRCECDGNFVSAWRGARATRCVGVSEGRKMALPLVLVGVSVLSRGIRLTFLEALIGSFVSAVRDTQCCSIYWMTCQVIPLIVCAYS